MSEITDVERLVAIEEIKRLKSRRDRAVDLKDWDTYRDCHAPNHQSANDGYEPWSRDDMLRHLQVDLAHVELVHLSHIPDIVVHGATTASGVWYLEDYHFWKQGNEDHWAHGFGWYHERYEKRDSRWVFTYRRIERLRVMASPGAISPLKTAALKTGHFRGPL